MWQLWLIIAGVFLITEIITVGFFIFWLGIAALITMIASFFISDIFIQCVIFVITSTILILLTKPFVNKLTNKDSSIKTNVYSIIGKNGFVLDSINSKECTGTVKVDGEIWSALSQNNLDIKSGTEITVIDIEGVKAIVTPK